MRSAPKPLEVAAHFYIQRIFQFSRSWLLAANTSAPSIARIVRDGGLAGMGKLTGYLHLPPFPLQNERNSLRSMGLGLIIRN